MSRVELLADRGSRRRRESRSDALRRLSCALLGSYALSFALPVGWQVSMGILLLATLAVVVEPSEITLSADSPYVGTLLFALATAVAVPTSVDAVRSLEFATLLLPGILLGTTLALAPLGLRELEKLFAAFTLLGLALGLLVVGKGLTGTGVDPHVWVKQIDQTILVVKNDVTFIALLAPLALVLSRTRSGPWRLVALGMLMAAAAAAVVFQSRGAMVGLVGGVASTLFYWGHGARRGLVALIVLLSAALGLDFAVGGHLSPRFVGLIDHAVHSRFDQWEIAWEVFLANPWLGSGPYTFAEFYDLAPWPHNLYLETLAGWGLVGLAVLVWVLVRGLVTCWRLRESKDRELALLAGGAFGSLVGVVLTAAVELTFLREWVALLFFALAAIVTRLHWLEERT